MQTEIIHRRTDGSIDYDFYRQQGLVERRAAMADFLKGLVNFALPLARDRSRARKTHSALVLAATD